MFKVLQYNILADCYTDDEHNSNLNKTHLDFKLRFPIIFQELKNSQADLMCLCEVDHLEEKYSKLLIEMGYQYYTESRRGKDSILIAFKPKVFEYVEHYGI